MFNATKDRAPAGAHAASLVMNMGWRYDVMVAVMNIIVFRGKLGTLLTRALDLAQLKPGETVLDVGCGTGSLVLQAKRKVGPAGRSVGIDPGVRQIQWAHRKAVRRGIDAEFGVGGIERLPYPDNSFDVVFSTLMMHHLPDGTKRAGISEVARVLAPGGRLVIVDFKRPQQKGTHLGAGELGMQDLPGLLRAAGFATVEYGDIQLPRFPGVHGAAFAKATR